MGPVRLGPCAVRTVSEGHWEGRSDRSEAAWLAKRVPFGPTPVGGSTHTLRGPTTVIRHGEGMSRSPGPSISVAGPVFAREK